MVLLSSEKYYWKGDTKSKTILFHGTKRNIPLFFLNTGNIFLIQLFLLFF